MNSVDIIYHHTAYVVDNIEESIERWRLAAGAEIEMPMTTVSEHGVAVAFLIVGGHRIEIIQAIKDNSALGHHTRGRGHPDHLCFLCNDLDDRIARLRETKGVLVRPPVSSEAFGGRRMCFVFYRGAGLIEWVEK